MASKTHVKLAVAQMPGSNSIARNLVEIEKFAVEAREQKADILCFPECALTGYSPSYHKSPLALNADDVASGVAEVRRIARKLRLAMILGTQMPLDSGFTNSTLLIRPDGRVPGQYDKIHLYGRDVEYYRAGCKRPTLARTRGISVGMLICFDIRFPELFRSLALGGGQIIFVPSYIHGPRTQWKNTVIASHVSSRAAENGRFVCFANTAGATQNVPSMIANPRGEIIAKCRRNARQLLVADINLREVNDNFASCRRPELY